jgi:hypothetical protein
VDDTILETFGCRAVIRTGNRTGVIYRGIFFLGVIREVCRATIDAITILPAEGYDRKET